MGAFQKLPGFRPYPPGQERVVLRRLPRILVVGSLLLVLPSLFARLPGFDMVALSVMTIDIYAISLLILHWTVVITIAIAAFIVLVMKGPAYVADAYPLVEDDASEGISADDA
ncbi:MAG: hypothetical protein D3M94_12850 [Rhodocyclales bacterium GT-UBC]|nr:MAG: hypothetical protein D3M94_12850 [Rhodocyclales bacterium GT-UBC]